MAAHSSTLAWKIPLMEEPGRLQSMGPKSRTRLRDFTFTFILWRRKRQPTPLLLHGESQGCGSLVGCRLWGCTESDRIEATQQQQQQHIPTSTHHSSHSFISKFYPKNHMCLIEFMVSSYLHRYNPVFSIQLILGYMAGDFPTCRISLSLFSKLNENVFIQTPI